MDKKVYLLSACVLTLMTAPIAAKAETFQSELQSSQQKIKTDLSAIKKQKQQVQHDLEAAKEKIEEIDQQLAAANDQILKKENKLNEINLKINNLKQEYKRINILLDSRKEEFKDRMASYYRTGGQMSFLNVIFSINSFGEFIDHFFAYDKIVNQDKQFIESYIADQNKMDAIKIELPILQESMMKQKAELDQIKSTPLQNEIEKLKLSDTLEKKKKQLEKEEKGKTDALELLQKNAKTILALIDHNENSPGNIQMITSIIAPFIPDALKLKQNKGVPASITIGQIILESLGSYNGLSGLAYNSKNLFGIKGTGTAGSVAMQTTEFVNGQEIYITAPFAKYSTYYDCMVDHANLLLTPRFQKYLKNVSSIDDYAHGIDDAGYATDPDYANKLIRIIDQYHLEKLDE